MIRLREHYLRRGILRELKPGAATTPPGHVPFAVWSIFAFQPACRHFMHGNHLPYVVLTSLRKQQWERKRALIDCLSLTRWQKRLFHRTKLQFLLGTECTVGTVNSQGGFSTGRFGLTLGFQNILNYLCEWEKQAMCGGCGRRVCVQ